MADVNFILTNAGAAALVNAANTGTDPVIISHCGVSATAVVPSAASTVLTGEIKRISTLSGGIVSPDTIHVIVRDESTASYTLRSLALYTDDGTLFAIYGQTGIIMQKSAGAMLLLTIDAKFVDVDASLISFGNTNFLNPPATETVQGVIEIATQAEAIAGADDSRALTPKNAKAALLPWLLAQDGAGSGIDADLLDGKQAAAFLELVNFTGAAVLAKLLMVDGAGSGLDADLLDGQQGSYYTDIIARLGFTPLNSTAFTAAAVLALMLGVDGSGSGVDADLLDGQHGSYYTNIIARLGFTPLNSTAFTAAAVLSLLLGVDGSGSGVDADLLDGQQGSYYADILARLGYTPLDSAAYTAADVRTKLVAVDGSGSGVDADLLDGQHGVYYADIPARMGVAGTAPIYAARAWVSFNGIGAVSIRNSGNVSSITDNGTGNYTVNLTTAMPDANYAIAGGCGHMSSVNADYSRIVGVPTTSSFRVQMGSFNSTISDSGHIHFSVHR